MWSGVLYVYMGAERVREERVSLRELEAKKIIFGQGRQAGRQAGFRGCVRDEYCFHRTSKEEMRYGGKTALGPKDPAGQGRRQMIGGTASMRGIGE